MSQIFQKNEKQLLREEFELVAANLKMIIHKKPENMNYYQKQLLLNILKKVIFIKESFDLKHPRFQKLALHLQLEHHSINEIVFKKGDKGQYFYIVLEGVYCVQTENSKDRRKQKNIYYYPGDSFGEVSLIYDVPRGATILANKDSSLLKIPKNIFNQCGDLENSIKYLNNFFENHSFFEKQDKFMIRIVSSLSKLAKFGEKQVIVDEGHIFNEILFFVKGQVNVYKTLKLVGKGGHIFSETILMTRLSEGDVFGQKYYLTREASNVKIVSVYRGEYIKVSFKDNISTIQTPLYKRIRQNANRFPTNQQLLEQYKIFLMQKCKQLQFVTTIYKNDAAAKAQLKDAKLRFARIKDSFLAQ